MKTLTLASVTLSQSTGTLTSNNTNVSNNDTVTIGTKVYTFKTALTPTEGEVLIGADADASLLNLIRAINHSGTPGTDYKCAAANADVTAATSVTSHAFAVTAIVPGLDGDSIATTETAATLSWGAATLTGGTTFSAAGTLADATFTFPSQQMTVGEFPSGNKNWSRAHRLSTDAYFCIRHGADQCAVTMSSLALLAIGMTPELTWPIVLSTDSASTSAVAPAAASFSVVVTANELTTTYQWQLSTDSGANWSNLSNGGVYSGATTATLAISNSTGLNGKRYRCVCSNRRGNLTSTSATLTVT